MRHSHIRLVAVISLFAAISFTFSCGVGQKKLSGEDRIFLQDDFWGKARAMFGEFGGGWWHREKSVRIRYEGGNWYVTEDHHYQLVVLDADKMEEYANVTISLTGDARVVSLRARTIKADGEIIRVTKDKVYEKSLVPGFMLFSDVKSKVFAMPGLSDGCILDYAYRIETQSLRFRDMFEFGQELPVRKAKYTYRIDSRLETAGYRLHYLDRFVATKPEAKVITTALGDMSSYSWTMEYLDAFPDEPWAPPRDRYVPTIYLAGFGPGERANDWNNFSKWYARLVPWLNTTMIGVEGVTDDVTAGADSPRLVIQRIMDYVGENIRYVSVSVEESGLKPHYPTEVLKNQYGDCKDMSCLVIAMLRHKGIEAYPALLLTRSEGVINKALVLPRFNHMIVYVPNEKGDIWLDPTAAPCPMGYLPETDRGVDALVLEGKKAIWRHIPEDCPFPCKRNIKVDLKITPGGDIEGLVKVVLSGDYAFRLSRRVKSSQRAEVKRALERQIASCFADVALDSCNLDWFDEKGLTMCLRSHLARKQTAIQVEDKLVVRCDFLQNIASSLSGITKGGGRKYPLWFPTSVEETDTVTIEAPRGWVAEEVPADVSIVGDYGSYSMRSRSRGNIVQIVVENRIKAGEIHGEYFDDFLKFWGDARDLLRRGIVFKRM